MSLLKGIYSVLDTYLSVGVSRLSEVFCEVIVVGTQCE